MSNRLCPRCKLRRRRLPRPHQERSPEHGEHTHSLTIAALRADGWTNIAAGLRWAGRNYLNPPSLLNFVT